MFVSIFGDTYVMLRAYIFYFLNGCSEHEQSIILCLWVVTDGAKNAVRRNFLLKGKAQYSLSLS
jgi:hypothetical protein